VRDLAYNKIETLYNGVLNIITILDTVRLTVCIIMVVLNVWRGMMEWTEPEK